MDVFYQPWSSLNPLLLRFYGGFHKFRGHDPSLTPLPAPLPSLENMEGAENPKIFIMAWSLWRSLPCRSHAEPTQNHLSRTKDAPPCSDHLRIYQSFRSPVSGMGKKAKCVFRIINRNIIGPLLWPHRNLGFLQSTHRPQNSSFSTFLNMLLSAS